MSNAISRKHGGTVMIIDVRYTVQYFCIFIAFINKLSQLICNLVHKGFKVRSMIYNGLYIAPGKGSILFFRKRNWIFLFISSL